MEDNIYAMKEKDYKQCKYCGVFFIDVEKHKNKVHGNKEQKRLGDL